MCLSGGSKRVQNPDLATSSSAYVKTYALRVCLQQQRPILGSRHCFEEKEPTKNGTENGAKLPCCAGFKQLTHIFFHSKLHIVVLVVMCEQHHTQTACSVFDLKNRIVLVMLSACSAVHKEARARARPSRGTVPGQTYGWARVDMRMIVRVARCNSQPKRAYKIPRRAHLYTVMARISSRISSRAVRASVRASVRALFVDQFAHQFANRFF